MGPESFPPLRPSGFAGFPLRWAYLKAAFQKSNSFAVLLPEGFRGGCSFALRPPGFGRRVGLRAGAYVSREGGHGHPRAPHGGRDVAVHSKEGFLRVKPDGWRPGLTHILSGTSMPKRSRIRLITVK